MTSYFDVLYTLLYELHYTRVINQRLWVHFFYSWGLCTQHIWIENKLWLGASWRSPKQNSHKIFRCSLLQNFTDGQCKIDKHVCQNFDSFSNVLENLKSYLRIISWYYVKHHYVIYAHLFQGSTNNFSLEPQKSVIKTMATKILSSD